MQFSSTTWLDRDEKDILSNDQTIYDKPNVCPFIHSKCDDMLKEVPVMKIQSLDLDTYKVEGVHKQTRSTMFYNVVN